MACVYHWDVFTNRPGKGNPAGIVLDANGLTDSDMQAIANAVGFNDTAFVLPSLKADVCIRYFSPLREVDLCGHATVAAFSALHEQGLLPDRAEGNYTLETKVGVLPITVNSSSDHVPLIVMTQGLVQFAKFNGSRNSLAQAIGINSGDFHQTLPITYGSTGRWTLLVPVKDLSVMQCMHPFQDKFAAALTDLPNASIHPFCLETIDARASVHARHFSSPTSGTIEDAVTGTASGVLGAYHKKFIAGRDDDNESLIIEQGYEVGREGTVQVWAVAQGSDYEVRIAGSACFVREIEVFARLG